MTSSSTHVHQPSSPNSPPSEFGKSRPRPPSHSVCLGRPPSLVQLTEAMRLNPDRWQQLKIETDAARLASGKANSSQSLPPSSLLQHHNHSASADLPNRQSSQPTSSSPSSAAPALPQPQKKPSTPSTNQASTPSLTPSTQSPASTTTGRLRLPPSSLHRTEALRNTGTINTNLAGSNTLISTSSSAVLPLSGSSPFGNYRLSGAGSNHPHPISTNVTSSNQESSPRPESALSQQQQHQLLLQRRASASDISLGFSRARAPSLAAIRERIAARMKPEMNSTSTASQSATEKSLGSTTPLTNSPGTSNQASTPLSESVQPSCDPSSSLAQATSKPPNAATPAPQSAPLGVSSTDQPSKDDHSKNSASEMVTTPQVTLSTAPDQKKSSGSEAQTICEKTVLTDEPDSFQNTPSPSKSIRPTEPKPPPGLLHPKAPNQPLDPTKPDVHPLQHSWTLFFDSRATLASAKRSPAVGVTGGQAYEAALQTIGTFNTVEEFCRYFNWTVRPSQMDMHSSVQIFKTGIKPMWEDPANSKGGKWTFTMKTNSNMALLDKIWMYLVLGLVGEQVDLYDDVCGAIVSTRPRGNRVQVWVREKENVERVNGLGKRLINLLEVTEDLGVSVEFTPHSGGFHGASKFISIQSHHNPTTTTTPHARSATVNGATMGTPTRPSIGGMVIGAGMGRSTEERVMAANEMRRSTSAEISSSPSRPNLVMHHSHINNQFGNMNVGTINRPGGQMKINQLNSNDVPIQIGVWRPSNGPPPGIVGRGGNIPAMGSVGVNGNNLGRRPQSYTNPQPGMMMGTPSGVNGRQSRGVNGGAGSGQNRSGQDSNKMNNRNFDGTNHHSRNPSASSSHGISNSTSTVGGGAGGGSIKSEGNGGGGFSGEKSNNTNNKSSDMNAGITTGS